MRYLFFSPWCTMFWNVSGRRLFINPITQCPQFGIFMTLRTFQSLICGLLHHCSLFHEFWFIRFLSSLSFWFFIKMHNTTCAPCPKFFMLVYNDFISNQRLLWSLLLENNKKNVLVTNLNVYSNYWGLILILWKNRKIHQESLHTYPIQFLNLLVLVLMLIFE